MHPYIDRRNRLLASIADGVAILPAARPVARNADSEYEFRQNSTFYYLTGFDEPDAVLVLAPEHPAHRSVLFLRTRDRAQEIWNGKRLGVERAVEHLGVDAAYPISELDERLPEFLCGARALYYDIGTDDLRDRQVLAARTNAEALTRRRGRTVSTIASAAAIVDRMRLIKSPEEIATMRSAARITGRGHEAAMRATRPGLYEYQIEAILEYEYRYGGAQSTAYESIVAGGENATILHYSTNRERLIDGTLLLVDSGCELDNYASDVTRTWPVSGRFSAEQRAIYDIVLAANEAGIAQVQPGRSQRAFHEAAVRTITEGLIDIGLLAGSLDENIERERYRDYYMHGSGHWLGLDVHDAGRYRDDDDQPIPLQPGMVTTVEPGIYVHADLNCDERFKGIGVRLEDNVLVTQDGNENLTEAIPKRIDAIEAIVGSTPCASVS